MLENIFLLGNNRWLRKLGYFSPFLLFYFSMLCGVFWLEEKYLLFFLYLILSLLILALVLVFIRNAVASRFAAGKFYAGWQIFSLSWVMYVWFWPPVTNFINSLIQ